MSDKKINNFLAKYKQDVDKVDNIISSYCVGKSSLIKEVSDYILSSGGKRIRPILVAMSAKLINPKIDSYHDLCAAIELIHTATLLHDDVVDDSQLRRGKKTANSIWENKASILIGDFLFSSAFQLMVRTNSIAILDNLSKASNKIADGEVNQLQNSKDLNISIDKYYEIIEGKTAALFSSACSSGAAIAGSSAKQESVLYEYGQNLGITFQIIDDILDYSQSSDDIGKKAGDDFFEAKVTLPVILCYKKAGNDDKKLIESLFDKSYNYQSQEKDLNQMVDLIDKYDAFNESYSLAQEHCNKAIDLLTIFEDGELKEDLVTIAYTALNRKK